MMSKGLVHNFRLHSSEWSGSGVQSLARFDLISGGASDQSRNLPITTQPIDLVNLSHV